MTKPSVACAALSFLLLGGVAHAGPITPVPAMVAFADTNTGSCDGPKSIDLQNKSGAAVSITDIQLTGADPGQFTMMAPGVPLTVVDKASVSLDVSFCPTGATGPRSANVSVTMKGQMAPLDIPLSGKAIGPTISVTPKPVVIGGVKLGAKVPPVTVTVANAGGGSLKVTGVSPAGADAGKFTFTGLPALPLTLGPGASFQFTMSYAPVAAGPATVFVHVLSNDPLNPVLDAPVQAYVGDPRVSLNLANLLFGVVNVGEASDPQDIDLTNAGYSDLTVTKVELVGNNPGDFQIVGQNPAAPFTLKVGAAARVTVRCLPTLVGNRTTNLSVTSDDPASPKLLPISCVGAAPSAMLDPGPLDFGAVRVKAPRTLPVNIKNGGDGPLTVNSIQLVDTVMGGKNAAAYQLDVQAPFVVAPKGAQVVNVTFSPAAVALYDKVALTVTTDDPKLPMGQLDVTGSGASPVLVVDPLLMDFGLVVLGQVAGPKNLTIRNAGNDNLKVTAFQIIGPNQIDFDLVPRPPKVPFSIAPGVTQTYGVTFRPGGNGGETASIAISTDDPNNGNATVSLDGGGSGASFSTVPDNMDTLIFDSTPVGATSKALSVKISNAGTAPLVIKAIKITKGPMDMPVPSTDFSIPDADARGFSVDPNKSHTMPITFTPSTAMALAGTLEIVPDDSVDPSIMPVYIFLQGQGFATTVSCLTATSDNSLDFGQALVGTTSGPLSLSIVNGSPNALPLVVSVSAPEFTLDRLTVSVPASQKLMLSALFSPDSARKFTGLIKLTLPNSSTPLCSIPVKGEGVVALGHDGGADAGLVLGPSPGCSCTVTAHGSSAPPALPLLVLVALLFRRRSRC